MEVSNVGGAGGGVGGVGQIQPAQSQQLQDLTGLSEKGVNSLVQGVADSTGVSDKEAAQALIELIQPSEAASGGGEAPSGGGAAGGAGGAEGAGSSDPLGDENGNGIPDLIEKLIEAGLIPPEKAEELLKDIGVPEDNIKDFLDKVGGEAAGTGGVGGAGGVGTGGGPGPGAGFASDDGASSKGSYSF